MTFEFNDDPAWVRSLRNNGCIDFSIGQPSKDLLPYEIMAQASKITFESIEKEKLDPRFLFQYGQSRGSARYRRVCSELVREAYPHRLDCPNENYFFATNGNSNGLHLCVNAFCKPGDTILVEANTYFLALDILKERGLNVVPVQVDSEGVVVDDELEQLFALPTCTAMYLIPTHQNPCGTILSESRRKKLGKFASDHNVLLISDDVYCLLHWGKEKAPLPLNCFTDNAVSLGTFSKIMAPGLRLGWIETSSPERIQLLSKIGYVQSGGGLNPTVEQQICAAHENNLLLPHIEKVKLELNKRCEALSAALGEYLPSWTFQKPCGGYFIWLKTPFSNLDVDLNVLNSEAQKEGVWFLPGQRTTVGENNRENHIRLCFAYYGSNILREGVRRLAKIPSLRI